MISPFNSAVTPVANQGTNPGGNTGSSKKPDDGSIQEVDNEEAQNTTSETPEERQLRLQRDITDAQKSIEKTRANTHAFQAVMGALSQGLVALASASGGGSGTSGGASAPKFGNRELQEENKNRGQNFFSSLDSNKINNIQQNLSKLPSDLARDINQFMNSKDSSSYNDINHRLSQFRDSDGEKLSLEKLAEENIEPVKQTEEIESISFPEE
jgi:hypothetical protein